MPSAGKRGSPWPSFAPMAVSRRRRHGWQRTLWWMDRRMRSGAHRRAGPYFDLPGLPVVLGADLSPLRGANGGASHGPAFRNSTLGCRRGRRVVGRPLGEAVREARLLMPCPWCGGAPIRQAARTSRRALRQVPTGVSDGRPENARHGPVRSKVEFQFGAVPRDGGWACGCRPGECGSDGAVEPLCGRV